MDFQELLNNVKRNKKASEVAYAENQKKYEVMINLENIIQSEFRNRQHFRKQCFWNLLIGLFIVVCFTGVILSLINYYLSDASTSIIKQDYAFWTVVFMSSVAIKELFSHYRDIIKIACGDYTNNQRISTELTSLLKEMLKGD